MNIFDSLDHLNSIFEWIRKIRKNINWKNAFIKTGQELLNSEHDKNSELYEQLSILFSKMNMTKIAHKLKEVQGQEFYKKLNDELNEIFSGYSFEEKARNIYINKYILTLQERLGKYFKRFSNELYLKQMNDTNLAGQKEIKNEIRDGKLILKEIQAGVKELQSDKNQNSVSLAYEILSSIEEYLLENGKSKKAKIILDNLEDKIDNLGENELINRFDLLKAICFTHLEEINKAKELYLNLSKRNPENKIVLLNLSELYIKEKDFENSERCFEEVRKIDKDDWSLKILKSMRDNVLIEEPNLKIFEDVDSIENIKTKSKVYEYLSLKYNAIKDYKNSEKYISNALRLRPNNIYICITELELLKRKMLAHQYIDTDAAKRFAGELLNNLQDFETTYFVEMEEIDRRIIFTVLNIKLCANFVLEKMKTSIKLADKILELSDDCYYDSFVEYELSNLLSFILIPEDRIMKLLERLKKNIMPIHDSMAKLIIFQLINCDRLFDAGYDFFKHLNLNTFVDFIDNLKKNNHNEILEYLSNDYKFAILIAKAYKSDRKLRNLILENLPDKKEFSKEKIRMLIHFEADEIEKAFDIVKKMADGPPKNCRPTKKN